MKKIILLLTILVGVMSASAFAQNSSNVPQFPPSSGNGSNSQNQTEVYNPSLQQPRKKRYVMPTVRIAFGVIDVICAETGRCLENDFRRTQTQNTVEAIPQQPFNFRSRTNQSQGIIQNSLRQVRNRRP